MVSIVYCQIYQINKHLQAAGNRRGGGQLDRNLQLDESLVRRQWAEWEGSITSLLACFLVLASCRTLKGTCSWPMGHLFCVWCGLRIQCATVWWRRWWYSGLDLQRDIQGYPLLGLRDECMSHFRLLVMAVPRQTIERTCQWGVGDAEVCGLWPSAPSCWQLQAVLCAPCCPLWHRVPVGSHVVLDEAQDHGVIRELNKKGAGGALSTGMVHMVCTDKVRQPEKVRGK